MMCRVLKLSRSGFYAWLKRPVCKRDQHRALVGSAVEATFLRFKKRYGAPRLTAELNDQGIACSRNYVAELLRERRLRARNGKQFRYFPGVEGTTNLARNQLWQDFASPAPNRKWVSDITYIKVGRNWMYLAAVMDLFSRKIVGWAFESHMRESLIIDALEMAVSRRETTGKLLIHSDRGVQYRGNDYQNVLRAYGIDVSMSRKGNCWDNAAMESFFSRLKVELVYAENFKTAEEAKSEIFQYIEIFYNRQRRHSSLGYVSPDQFEQQFEQSTLSTFRG
jgi:transposase InsO family protein